MLFTLLSPLTFISLNRFGQCSYSGFVKTIVLFKIIGTLIIQGRMPSFSVVLHFYILKNFRLCILEVIKSAILHQFCFKAAETGFYKCIVIRY